MKIQNVTDDSFRKYGKVLEGYDFTGLLKEMKHMPVPVSYTHLVCFLMIQVFRNVLQTV